MTKDSIIVVSGGMDSITLLYDRKDYIALAVTFDYGSNHNAREIPFARLHCERLGIPHIVIPLDFMHNYFKSSLLEGADARKHEIDRSAIPKWYHAVDSRGIG